MENYHIRHTNLWLKKTQKKILKPIKRLASFCNARLGTLTAGLSRTFFDRIFRSNH
ncbi:unnamed protein product [Ixodes pacificus]